MRTVLITGASRGLGLEIARQIVGRGDHAILVARTESDLSKNVAELRRHQGRADYLVADLSTTEGAQKLARAAIRRFPKIDTLVLNAGHARHQEFSETKPDTLHYEFEVNYFAPAALLHCFARTAVGRRGGRIVAIGSLTSEIPFPGNANYAASKAAFAQLLRTLRVEWKDRGVHIGLVVPGYMRSEMTKDMRTLVPATSQQVVAKNVVSCLDRGTSYLIPGIDNRIAERLSRLFPDTFDSVLKRISNLVVPRVTKPSDEAV